MKDEKKKLKKELIPAPPLFARRGLFEWNLKNYVSGNVPDKFKVKSPSTAISVLVRVLENQSEEIEAMTDAGYAIKKK